MFESKKVTVSIAGVGLALALALSGCAGKVVVNEKPADPATSEAAPATSEAAPATSDAPESSSAPESSAAETSAATGGDGDPSSLGTAPGTKLKLGEKATTMTNTGKKGSDKYKEASYEIAITKIIQGSPDDLKVFDNAEKYAGQTPYYVVSDVKLTKLSAPTAGISDPRVNAIMDNNKSASRLIVMGSFDKCKTGRFETEGSGDSFTYKVGSTKEVCSVFLVPEGKKLETIELTNSGFNYTKYSDNPYNQDPITWTK